MNARTTFGSWVKQRRKALDVTQQELADLIGCSQSAIQLIESGRRRASRQVADLLAEHLRVPPSERDEFLRLARAGSYQQEHTTVADESRAAATVSTPNNLPAPLTPLFGREEATQAVMSQLLSKEVRLLTLTGAPGIGKTALAMHIASLATPYFNDGVYWVALASTSDPAIVSTAIMQPLGVRDTGLQSPSEVLPEYLRDKQLLLVLDNFEQVMPAAAEVARLLESCPRVKVLVTSRESLRTSREWVYQVPPLELPDLSAFAPKREAQELADFAYEPPIRERAAPKTKTPPPQVEKLASNPAVALFVERARAARPGFALTEENALPTATLCVRLDGLPLAIELAAPWVRLVTPGGILSRAEGPWEETARQPGYLGLLTRGRRDRPERHQTLRDAISWSYDLLGAGEQMLFRRLGVFVGGWSLPAAEAVCNAHSDLPVSVLEGMAVLLDKNLIKEADSSGSVEGEPRFAMLETLREYALERLEQRGEAEMLRRLHAEYFLAWVQATEKQSAGEKQLSWAAAVKQDYDNLRATLHYAISRGDGQLALQLSSSIGVFWEIGNYWSEGRQWLERALSLGQAASDGSDSTIRAARARALWAAGRLHTFSGNGKAAYRLYEESLALRRELGDKAGVASTLLGMGNLAWVRGDYGHARAMFEESLALRRELGDRWGIANALAAIGFAACYEGEYATAEAALMESLSIARGSSHSHFRAGVVALLAEIAGAKGEFERAQTYLHEAMGLIGDLESQRGRVWVLVALGNAALWWGVRPMADTLFGYALANARRWGEQSFVPYCLLALEGLASVECASGNHGAQLRAATVLGAAHATREKMGIAMPPSRKDSYEATVAAVRKALGDAAFSQAWHNAQAMTLKQALDYALERWSEVHTLGV